MRISTCQYLQNFSLFLLFYLAAQTKVFACDKTLSISVAKDWPPFSYREQGAYKGLDIEITERILKSINYCWRYYSYPSSSRALLELKKGNIDLIFAASYSQERASYATYSKAYRYEVMQLFSNTKYDKETSYTRDSLIAINRGGYYGENFADYMNNCSECIVEVNLASERINLVSMGRVDFAAEELLAGIYIINQNKLNQFVQPTNITINSNPVYYMLNPARFDAQDVKKLNKAIESNDEAINQLVETYQQRYSEVIAD